MKKTFLSIFVTVAVLAPVVVPSAHALSCLPIDMYLKDVVGKEEVVIFTGTATDQITETDYTAEVVTVTEAKQGYLEAEIFVYHEKSHDWGYFCNQGPGKEGEKGVYVATRDAQGKYTVHQRLSPTDPLVKALETDLEDAEVEGGVSEITPQDHMNQLMTTMSDLLKQIQILFKEYLYWKTQ